MRIVIMTAVLYMVQTGAAQGQSPSPHNGATWYQQAIQQYQSFQQNSPQDWELLLSYHEGEQPSPAIRQALARIQPILDLARRGSSMEYCDFDMDRSQGIELMLPHLNPLRGIGKLMRADAVVRLQDGDTSTAAGRLADMYRMSGHFGDDRVIISSLVGNAVFTNADSLVQTALDRGALGETESAALVSALDRLSSMDPFAYVESVMGEQEMMVGWLREKAATPEGLAGMAAMMDGDGFLDKDSPLMFMSQEQFDHEVDLYDSMMGRVVDMFNNPDRAAAKEDLQRFEEEIQAMAGNAGMGGEGFLVAMLLPALGKVMERLELSEKTLAERHALLSTLAAGKAKPEEFANAAIWYVRGIEMIEKLNAENLAAIRVFAADTSVPLNEELAAVLAAPPVQDIVAVFAEGSGKRRCDFSIAREGHGTELIPTYAPGMHDAFRILHADAIRRLNAATDGQPWDAVDRFATCLRIIGHISSDPTILSSLIAHHNCDKTAALLESAFTANALPTESKAGLFDALERSSRRDPFGYVGAIVATRTALAQQLSRQYWPLNTEADAAQRTKLSDSIKALTGDQLLYLIANINAMERNAAASRAEQPPPVSGTTAVPPAFDPVAAHDALVKRVSDVISYADLEAAQQDTAIIGPALAQGTLDVLADRMIPSIAASRLGGNLAEHARRARSDLRRAATLLRPHESREADDPASGNVSE